VVSVYSHNHEFVILSFRNLVTDFSTVSDRTVLLGRLEVPKKVA